MQSWRGASDPGSRERSKETGATGAGTGKGGTVSEAHLPRVQADDQAQVKWSWKLSTIFPRGHRTVHVACKSGTDTAGFAVGDDVQQREADGP